MWRTEYERKVDEEIQAWQKRILKRSNLFNRMSKKAQNNINGMIPDKAHKVITEAIKNMVKSTLFGYNHTTNKTKSTGMRLDERDDLLKEKLSSYRKTAVAEGAGTGAGGIFLGLADIGRASCREREEISAIDGGIINKENK